MARQNRRSLLCQPHAVTDFVRKYQQLDSQVIDDTLSARVDEFFCKLPLECAAHVRLQRLKTIREHYEEALHWAAAYQPAGKTQQIHLHAIEVHNPVPDPVITARSALTAQIQQMGVSQRGATAEPRRRKLLVCWNCQQPGHTRSQCQLPAKNH